MNYGVCDVEVTGYDVVGNILGLNRKGMVPSSGNSSCMTGDYIDQLTYNYSFEEQNKSRLLSVTDGADQTKGFLGQETTYTYDAAGNVTSDASKGIVEIGYNYLNLPRVISFKNGSTIEFTCDANGRKLRKRLKGPDAPYQRRAYAGGIEYLDPSNGGWELEFITHAEGRWSEPAEGRWSESAEDVKKRKRAFLDCAECDRLSIFDLQLV